jgi:hypothetical protein
MPGDAPGTDSIPVRFSGPGAGRAPLTWGQKQVLLEMAESGQTLNMGDVWTLRRPATVSEAAAQFADMISRHPSLRTRFPAQPDGRPGQVVTESGELCVPIVDLPDNADDAETSACVRDIYDSHLLTPFDHARDWPVRMAVVRQRGLARYLPWTASHLVGDAVMMSRLQGELGYGVLAGHRADPGPMAMLELARLERTPRLLAVSDRSMRYWESQLERLPPLTFGPARYPGRLRQRYWHGQFNSAAAYLATLAIARQTGTDTGRVLLALIAIAVGRATGVCPLTVKFIVHNRFRPGYREVMAPLSQSTAVTVDVAGGSVAAAIARTRRAVTAGAMHGYFDPDQLAGLTEQLDARRGYPAQITCHINDPRVHARAAAEAAVRAQEVTAAEIQRALDETRFSWDGTVPGDYYTDQAFLTILEQPEQTVLLQFVFDMACFTEAQAEGLAREIERAAVEAAADPESPTRAIPGQAQY